MKYIYALLISLFLPTVVFAQSVPVSWLRNVASGFLTPLNINDSVGIGTVSPQNKLEISGTSAGATLGLLRLSNIGVGTSTGPRLIFTTKDSGNFNLSSTIDSIATDITSAQGKSDLVFSVTNIGSLVERMRILSSGNVGIGSTTPVSQLTVQKTIVSDVDYPALSLSRDDTTNALGDSLGDIDFWSNDASTDGPGIGSRIRGVVDDVAGRSYGLSLWTRSGGAGTPISEKMRIASDGKVGIGTTTPFTTLSVVGDGWFENGSTKITVKNSANTVKTEYASYSIQSYNSNLFINAAGNNVIFSASSNIGVGSTTPFSKFSIENLGSGNSFMVSDQLLDSSPFVIDNAGNVGIGTTSPWTRLAVTGSTTIAGGPLIVLGSANTPISADTDWYRQFGLFRKDINDYAFTTFENRNGGSNASVDLLWNNDRTTALSYYADLGFNSTAFNNPVFGNLNVANAWYGYNTDGPILWATATTSTAGYFDFTTGGYSSSRMRITSTGNVGIGTTSPGALLDVYKSASTGGHVQLDVRGQTTGDYVSTSVSEGVNLRLQNYNLNNGGAVGLVFNPYSDVSGSARIAGISNVGGDVSLAFQISNNTTIAEAMRIDNLSNVGIGTTTPQSTLSVGSVNDATNSYAQIDSVNGAPTAGDCDTDLERGRMIIDYSNNRFYICNGATRGWDYSALTD